MVDTTVAKPSKSIFQSAMQFFQTPGLSVKTNFFRLLSVSEKAGLGVRQALMSILKSETDKGMQMVIRDLLSGLNQGESLATAMSKHNELFGNDETELIRSSENMGNMPEVLAEVAQELENFQKIKQKVIKAMTYPATLMAFTVIAVAVLLIKVIPTIVTMFPDPSALPDITKIMIAASDFMIANWYYVFGGIAGIFALYFLLYNFVLMFKIFIDKLMVVIPVVKNVTKTFYMYRFSKLLSDFYRAGVSPVDALSQMANIFENYHFKKKMVDMRSDLEKGFGFAESLEGSDLFDSILVQIILVGEETGNIGDVLAKMAVFYREQLEYKIDALTSAIEPILMAFIAVVIGSVVGSIFLPMADLVNVLGQ